MRIIIHFHAYILRMSAMLQNNKVRTISVYKTLVLVLLNVLFKSLIIILCLAYCSELPTLSLRKYLCQLIDNIV